MADMATPVSPTETTLSTETTSTSSSSIDEMQISFTIGVTEGTPYPCQFCDKAFPRLSYLKRHEQIHSDQMPFRCDYCHRLFKHKRSRDRHIKLHTGDKRYKCAHCESAFSRSDHLKIHMKTHDNMKPFQCKICNRGYNTAAALTSHMQNHKRNNSLATNASTNCSKALTAISKTQSKSVNHIHAENSVNHSDNNSSTNNIGEKKSKGSVKESESEDEGSVAITGSEVKSESNAANNKPQETAKNNPINNDVNVSANSTNHSHEQQVTCGFCGNKCAHLDVHIRESHLHHLLLAGLLQNSFYNSTFPKWPPFMPPPPLPLTHPSEIPSMQPPLTNGRMSSPSSPKKPKISSSFNGLSPASSSSPLHHLPVPLLCNQCSPSPSFPDFESFRIHLKSHLMATQTPTHSHHQCPYCGDVITSDFEGHVVGCRLGAISNHQLPVPLLCNQCSPSPTFPDFESFRIHLKSHLMASQQSLSSSLSLTTHHQCPYCGDVIATDFESHIVNCRLGTITTQYGCEACNKMFTKPEELQKHLMDIHAHHLYQCSLCRDMFDSKVSIQVHFAVKHSTVSLKKFSI
ncbi:zinc finger protein 423-like protein [Dinothrombium tinctorium]|uniref:Zinc finger protein 423-like protein n=1 Tax=Dinothrombium tinctorium TaxID=1965070 RepID=A0A3S3SQR3_9ACAR|nr:zinc finger protein 423-like protein [Dinothrombium tinctorium]